MAPRRPCSTAWRSQEVPREHSRAAARHPLDRSSGWGRRARARAQEIICRRCGSDVEAARARRASASLSTRSRHVTAACECGRPDVSATEGGDEAATVDTGGCWGQSVPSTDSTADRGAHATKGSAGQFKWRSNERAACAAAERRQISHAESRGAVRGTSGRAQSRPRVATAHLCRLGIARFAHLHQNPAQMMLIRRDPRRKLRRRRCRRAAQGGGGWAAAATGVAATGAASTGAASTTTAAARSGPTPHRLEECVKHAIGTQRRGHMPTERVACAHQHILDGSHGVVVRGGVGVSQPGGQRV
eukprot:scaffold21487_cov105-Isochrysis_galbana.AAC.9